jgi:hypothetical protein
LLVFCRNVTEVYLEAHSEIVGDSLGWWRRLMKSRMAASLRAF